jgi:thymidylate synthase (FAD)
MQVKLISYTQPTQELYEQGVHNCQDMLAYCAKVSNPQNQMNLESSARLIKYLIKHQHWSVFEMADATLEIITTRDIARQLLRHRSFNFQELSQRYADPAVMGAMFVTREARLQDTTNRQNSIATDDADLQEQWDAAQQDVIDLSREVYDWAISNGIAKEQARAVFPEGNTLSKVYMKGNIRSWIHYCALRAGNGTQLEHMMIAQAAADVLCAIIPDFKQFCELE